MKEVWRDVVGHEGQYQVSNMGNVNNVKYGKPKPIKLTRTSLGFYTVALYKGGGKCDRPTINKVLREAFFDGKHPKGLKMSIDIVNGEASIFLVKKETKGSRHIYKNTNTSSKYIGVTWCKSNKKWSTMIRHNGKQIFLGYFENEDEAGQAYQDKLADINKILPDDTKIPLHEYIKL